MASRRTGQHLLWKLGGNPGLEPAFSYNYGGSIGGPVIVPKLYNGHNRTFFWASAEAYRQQEAASTVLAVPTALERLGDFSRKASPTREDRCRFTTR